MSRWRYVQIAAGVLAIALLALCVPLHSAHLRSEGEGLLCLLGLVQVAKELAQAAHRPR